jgi:hypothetical protein
MSLRALICWGVKAKESTNYAKEFEWQKPVKKQRHYKTYELYAI